MKVSDDLVTCNKYLESCDAFNLQ